MPEGTSTARRLRPSPSIIISIFALVVAMSSGAYAAVTIAEKNSVVSKSIKDKNVKSADIKPSAVKKKHLAANSVNSSKIVDGQVGSADIGDGQVGTADIGDGQVGANDLAAGSVNSGKVVDGSLGASDLAPGTIPQSPVAALASGQTVRGTIGHRENNLLAGQETASTASLPVAAPVALTDDTVRVDGVDDPGNQCTGSATNPTAPPGVVCMYPWFTGNSSTTEGFVWGNDIAAGTKWGFQVSVNALGAGAVAWFANWAYTAP
jgi:hypothetical protein